MFHPIYNADGKLSLFRVFCLLTVAICMGLYGWLRMQGRTAQETAAVQPAAAEEVFAGGSGELVKRRNYALAELADRRAFLNTCASINAGFESCRFNFTEGVSNFYDSKMETADGGYMIVLTAKGEQQKDVCTQLGMSSTEGLFARDRQGSLQPKCIPQELREEKPLALLRATDTVVPQQAPSGRSPAVTETASGSAVH